MRAIWCKRARALLEAAATQQREASSPGEAAGGGGYMEQGREAA